jgi:hypothetical protein
VPELSVVDPPAVGKTLEDAIWEYVRRQELYDDVVVEEQLEEAGDVLVHFVAISHTPAAYERHAAGWARVRAARGRLATARGEHEFAVIAAAINAYGPQIL